MKDDKLASAPESGIAIPLPAANTNVYAAKPGGNVPEPPAANGPMIGPLLPANMGN
jgi:hypothetical protein